MPDQFVSVVIIVLLFIGLPVVILATKDRITRARRRRPSQRARHVAEREAYEQRILEPDWACVERHLRRPVPRPLRELYADRSLVMARDLRYSMDYSLSSFEALDEQAMADTRAWLGFEAVAIASTPEGDAIYLRPGPSDADVVYLTHHDGGDTEVFAPTLQQMVDTVRRS